MKHYSPTGRRNYGRPLKRLLDKWDRNRSTSGPTPWEVYDDDDDDDDELQTDLFYLIAAHKSFVIDITSISPQSYEHLWQLSSYKLKALISQKTEGLIYTAAEVWYLV